jgi:hypothetical protein
MKKLKYLSVQFENELAYHEIEKFRGAVIHTLSEPEVYALFHNHIDDKFAYRYPLIQYKSIGKKAALICLDEGADQIHAFFSRNIGQLRVGQRHETFTVEKLSANQFTLQVWDKMFDYSLIRWLPLKPENHKLYVGLTEQSEKISFLEKMLTGNLLSFAKGVGWHVDKPVQVKITELKKAYSLLFKEQSISAFDIEFQTNIFLPNFIGLGKGSGKGYGVIKSKKQTNLNIEKND